VFNSCAKIAKNVLFGKKCYLSPIDVNDTEIFTEWLNNMDILPNEFYEKWNK